jgi:hypothetical protein
MTPIQEFIFNHIVENQPICDKCLATLLGFNHSQQANTICRELRNLKTIIRPKDKCPKCNKNVIINLEIHGKNNQSS